ALDMMGGDFAPLEAVKGLLKYFSQSKKASVVYCLGDEDELEDLFEEYNMPPGRAVMFHTSEIIEYKDHPTKALREKPDSSIAKGFELLASGKVDAFLSSGNTGAMLVGSMFFLKPLEGILRPTISTMIPKIGGGTGLVI